jgi:hypothetical protein
MAFSIIIFNPSVKGGQKLSQLTVDTLERQLTLSDVLLQFPQILQHDFLDILLSLVC